VRLDQVRAVDLGDVVHGEHESPSFVGQSAKVTSFDGVVERALAAFDGKSVGQPHGFDALELAKV
jgi:hypothetical protein